MKSFLINPVLNKEFKLRFRSLKTFIGLLAYLLAIALIVVGFILLMTEFRGSSYFRPEQSRELFVMLSFIQLALILFITPGLTAGVISGEREKQTLNILLTTVQSSTSIILSKLFSSFLYLLLLIVASLPLYSMVFLFGGVAPATLLAVFGLYVFTIIVFCEYRGILFDNYPENHCIDGNDIWSYPSISRRYSFFIYDRTKHDTNALLYGANSTNQSGRLFYCDV